MIKIAFPHLRTVVGEQGSHDTFGRDLAHLAIDAIGQLIGQTTILILLRQVHYLPGKLWMDLVYPQARSCQL